MGGAATRKETGLQRPHRAQKHEREREKARRTGSASPRSADGALDLVNKPWVEVAAGQAVRERLQRVERVDDLVLPLDLGSNQRPAPLEVHEDLEDPGALALLVSAEREREVCGTRSVKASATSEAQVEEERERERGRERRTADVNDLVPGRTDAAESRRPRVVHVADEAPNAVLESTHSRVRDRRRVRGGRVKLVRVEVGVRRDLGAHARHARGVRGVRS